MSHEQPTGSDPGRGSDPSSSTYLEPAALNDESEREFEQWVRGRLSNWSIADIRAFDRWLLDESHSEFVPAVRGAWMQRSLEELDCFDSEEPAA